MQSVKTYNVFIAKPELLKKIKQHGAQYLGLLYAYFTFVYFFLNITIELSHIKILRELLKQRWF